MARPTTGLRPLDDLIGGLRIGDNVVWEIEEDVSVDPFVSAFVRSAGRSPGLAYVSFHVPPDAVLNRLREEWKSDSFVLVDCFTDGIGRADDTFERFYRSRRGRQVRVERVGLPSDPGAVAAVLDGIERELGLGARYIFDSLTGMQELWGPAEALAFFSRSCPKLYDLRTVAYWILDRKAHGASFLTRLAHVTQVVLDVWHAEDAPALKVIKAEARPPEVLGRRARFSFEGGRMRIRHESEGAREQLGELLRTQRVARGLPQAELARRVGISPSALSQAERGRIGLSAETLMRAWEVLEVELGAADALRAPGLRITRRGARGTTSIAAGMVGEEMARTPSGAAVHLLTVAPGASGRRPPFATKRDEIAVVTSGLLELRVGEARETLHAGDAVLLSSEPVAGWRNPGPDETKVLWTILPA